MTSSYILYVPFASPWTLEYLPWRLYFSHWRTARWWRPLCLPAEETGEGTEIFRLRRLPDGQAGRPPGPRSHPSVGPAHWRGTPHPWQCPGQEEFHHSRWVKDVWSSSIKIILQLISGTNTAGAPPGHPVGQPLPNPAMARLLWSTSVSVSEFLFSRTDQV